MSHELNLAKRPFFNPRPVLRVTILLWVLGAAVAAFNVRLYFSHYSGSSEIIERQEGLGESVDRERQRVRELEAELARYDLTLQNDQADFLNSKIAERSFSWSMLFDRLGEVMPADVRLSSLSPSFGNDRGRSRSETLENEVLLGIRGTAKSSEVVLEFIDSLFEHSSFRAPNLISESLQESTLLDFNLNVIYEPRLPAAEDAGAGDESQPSTEGAGEPVAGTDAPEPPDGGAENSGQAPATTRGAVSG